MDYVRNSCICKIDEVTTTYNNITRTVMQNLNYRPFAGPDTMNNGAGAVSNLYDQFGRIQTANPAATHQRTYTYDGNSNLEGIAAGPARHSESYTYDPLNRLESAKGGIYGQISYTYDNVGNRLARTANGIGEVYTYRLRTNRIDRITGPNAVTVFSHDGNGNITAMGNRTLVYNQHNRLVRVEQGGATLGEYTYNGMEQRAVKITSGGTTLFHYDLEGNLIAESDENGTFTAEYLYSGKTVLAKVNVATDRILFYHNSHLGTPLAMADDSDTIVWEGLYQPFGNALVNPYSTEENNLRFAGQYYDSETGLHYNYHRYYDPSLGRYLRADPIGLAGGINLYAYVQNNPVSYIDPYGLIKWGAVIRGGSAMIAGGFAVVGGAAASTTGVGAIAGVPAVIGGSATFGWGTAELISGFLDSETNIPTPSAAALGTLVATGDMEKAQKADMIQDIVTLGYGTAKFMGSAPTSDMALELFEIGNEWVYVTSQGVDYGESQCE